MEMQELLKILACPACHGNLDLLNKNDKQAFYCKSCNLVFRIEEDIPIMLISEAVPLQQWEKGE